MLQSPQFCLYKQPTDNVSRTGIDTDLCGTGDGDNYCGTLYQASININNNHRPPIDRFEYELLPNDIRYEIHILDGQNENEIVKHLAESDHEYNPCLPVTFEELMHVTITFNPNIIKTMTDWMPGNICIDNNYNTSFDNEYLFDGGSTLIVRNLIVDDYVIGDYGYSLIRCDNDIAYLQCYNCLFQNISHYASNLPLVHSKSRIRLINTTFSNIETSGMIIHSSGADPIEGDVHRIISIKDSIIANIVSQIALIYIKESGRDPANGVSIIITDSVFDNISLNDNAAIMKDYSNNCNFTMVYTNINIRQGLIYEDKREIGSFVNMNNITISTAQVIPNEFNGRWPLFRFSNVDVVSLQNIHYLFDYYNISESCAFSDTYFNSYLKVFFSEYKCQNPITVFENHGHLEMRNIVIDMNIYYPEHIKEGIDYTLYTYVNGDIAEENGAFIVNHEELNVQNVKILQSYATDTILNDDGILSVHNLSMQFIRNPNLLHSSQVIQQIGNNPSMDISHSSFYNGWGQIHLRSGSLFAHHCSFQQAAFAVHVTNANNVIISNNIFKNNGRYYNKIETDPRVDHYLYSGTQVWYSSNTKFINNNFSGFEPKGLLAIYYSQNTTLQGNIFDVKIDDNIYYNLTSELKKFVESPVDFVGDWQASKITNAYTRVIANQFRSNNVDPSRPFLQYSWGVYGNNCLYGNLFRNKGLAVYGTNVTSCLRPKLIDCLVDDFANCTTTIHGEIDESLLETTDIGGFVVDDYLLNTLNDSSMIQMMDAVVLIEGGSISLNYNASNDTGYLSKPYINNLMNHSKLFFTDTIIMNEDLDVWYDADICNIMNNRLSTNTQYITSLMIDCDPFREYSKLSVYDPTMLSSNTRFVNHSVATKISITPKSNTYYSKQQLQFLYRITDILGNDIPSWKAKDDVEIILQGSYGDNLKLILYQNGSCPSCKQGIVFNVSTDNYGEAMIVNISVDGNVLISPNDSILLDIICPPGYEPNEDMTCIKPEKDNTELIIIISVCVVAAIIIVSSACIYWYRKQKNRSDKAKKESDAKYSRIEATGIIPDEFIHISNALVLIITIGKYDAITESNADIDIDQLQDIDAANIDYNHLKNVFALLKYRILPTTPKDHWTQVEVIDFLKTAAKEVVAEDGELAYDGLVVVISGHGIENHVITSDIKAIQKAAIHRIFSADARIRDIPRIFLFDSCDGSATKIFDNEENTDNGKYFGLNDVLDTLDMSDDLWKNTDHNPDYKLAEIHAANIGFQAKFNEEKGSHMIHKFCKRMIGNIVSMNNDKRNECIGSIFDAIQKELHDEGKQQIIHTFNNNTQYVNFDINIEHQDEELVAVCSESD